LAEDLERWLCGQPTEARPQGRWRKLLSGLRRRPLLATALVAATLLLVLAPVAGYLMHQGPPEVVIEQRLASGEPVTLIPPVGPPAWSEAVLGQAEANLSILTDGTFSLSSSEESYLELVRNTHRDSYVFRAEVHHLTSRTAGAVGLYFLHGRGETSRGPVHWFYYVAFDDVVSAQEAFDKMLKQLKKPGVVLERPAGNLVSVGSSLYGIGPTGSTVSHGISSVPAKTFTPRPPHEQDHWRALRVSVTPEKVRVAWDGEGIAEINAADLAAAASFTQPVLKSGLFGGPDVPAVRFSPQSGLGLYVKCGSASFRNVAVEPFDAGP
jgi:hypothetical protein